MRIIEYESHNDPEIREAALLLRSRDSEERHVAYVEIVTNPKSEYPVGSVRFHCYDAGAAGESNARGEFIVLPAKIPTEH